jgi:hypothetical protein
MKTTCLLILAIAAGLSVQLNAEQVAGPSPINHRAARFAPRTLEEFPELLRSFSAPVPAATTMGAEGELQTSRQNSLVAFGPRFLEENPQLLRAAPAPQEASARDALWENRVASINENRAVAASPRVREEIPELLRKTPEFEIAPVK